MAAIPLLVAYQVAACLSLGLCRVPGEEPVLDPALRQSTDEEVCGELGCGVTAAKRESMVWRGWGSGGLPFSILYMEPRAPPQPTPRPSLQIRALPRPRSQRLRLSASRRQYSIIPQLFVSYGWGPLGKRTTPQITD